MFTQPSLADFKAYFFRDFKYTIDPDFTGVVDLDITKAQGEAFVNINDELFCDQDTYTLCFNYLTAHYLCVDLTNSSQGVNGSYSWLTSSKGVGSVSESYAIPDRIMQNPELAMFTKTGYGAKFLSMILPLLSGQIFTVHGRTKA